MSHSDVLVLLMGKNPNIEVNNEDPDLTAALAPFNEELQVSEYEVECYCIGIVAEAAARLAASSAVGSMDDLRASFWARQKTDPDADVSDAAWERHISAYTATYNAALAAHPDRESPKPECESCEGTGKRKTTYNPKARWDWYVVGGRWSGSITDTDPIKNPRNYQPCWLCAGTGKRDDGVGKAMRAQDPNYTCNGCSGSGRQLRPNDQWTIPARANQILAKDLAERIRAGTNKPMFAALTPDGEWVESGKMGWWGIVSDEKAAEEWKQLFLATLDRYPEALGVIVDVHI